MTAIPPATLDRHDARAETPPRRRRRDRTRSGSRANTILGWALVAVVAAAAVPFGSNRPFFWCLWAASIGALGLGYAAALRFRDEALRIPVSAIRLPFMLFLVVAAVMLVQIAPVGDFLPVPLRNQFGESIPLRTPSVAPGDTWLALLRWLTYGALFFLMAQVSVQRGRNRQLLQALVAVVSVEAIYALVALTQLGDTILFFDKAYYHGVATGTFVNRNSLATFLGLGVVAATALATGGKGGEEEDKGPGPLRSLPREHPLLLVAIFAMMVALVATQSRMGLFSTLAGVAAVLLLRRQAGGIGRGTVLLVLGGIAVVLVLYGAGVADRFLMTERSAGTRLELYRQVAAMIAERPLLGYGAGSFNQAFPLFHDPALAVDVVWEYAHSTYLDLWAGLGVFAGTVPLLLVAVLVFTIFRAARRRGRHSVEGAAALGATATVALHSLVDFGLEMQAVALLYVSLLALGSARAIYNGVRADG